MYKPFYSTMIVSSSQLCLSLVTTSWTSQETYSGQGPVSTLDHQFLTIASLALYHSKASPQILEIESNETVSSTRRT